VQHNTELDEHLMIREGRVKKKPTYMQLLCILLKTRVYQMCNPDVFDCHSNHERYAVCFNRYSVLDDQLFH
jgi:hypothetical protein